MTNFIEQHPGGDKLLLAAGGSVEPFWLIYAQHKADYVMEILETLRIGTLDSVDMANASKEMVLLTLENICASGHFFARS